MTGFIRCMFILLFISGSTALASDNSSVLVEISTRKMTPGEQFELRLTVTYDDGIEAVFNPRQQAWADLEFIDYQMIEPRWQQDHWVSVYLIQVAAPLAGSYQLPPLPISFYQGADHWNIKSPPLPYEVISVFLGAPEIQPLLPLPATPSPVAPLNPVILFGVLPLTFMVLLLGWHFGANRVKPMALWNQSLRSPDDLARQALHEGTIDWESLRLWLIVVSGCDPLGRLTTDESLLHQYQQIRFQQGGDPRAYATLCQRCQERWE